MSQFTEADHPRGTAGQFVEKAAADPGTAVLDDTQTRPFERACTEAGLPMMAGILRVVEDRGSVHPETLASLTDANVDRMYWDHIGPVVDQIEDATRSISDTTGKASASKVQSHIAAICDDAGLPAMTGILQVVSDRENATGRQLLSLTSDQITAMYEEFAGPAIDDLEQELLDSSCRACGDPIDDGEGSDGYCGNCADARSCSECGELISDDLEDIPASHLCRECGEDE